jgi:hypothetical protein
MLKLIIIASLCLGLVACGGSGSKDSTPERYQITAAASPGGSVHLNNTSVFKGSTTSASVVPDDHYEIASVIGCGGKLFDNTYQTGTILLNCTITATFNRKSYKVTVTRTTGGAPNVYTMDVPYTDLAKFSFTADPGYHIVSVSSDCGGSLSVAIFTSGPISANCTVKPVFELDSATAQTQTYLVTVTSAVGGNSSPGSITVTKNDYAKFDLVAEVGYHIESVTSNCGGSLVLIRFTTGRVNVDCSIQPHFVLNTGVIITPSTDPTEVAEITGTVAQGAPIKSTVVSARCSDGTNFIGTVITNAQGKFAGQVLKSSLPCALSVTGSSYTYYSFVTAGGNVNITPLTSLILAYGTAQAGAVWYSSSNWQSVIYNIAVAQTNVGNALSTAGYTMPVGDFLPFTTQFVVGDNWDKLLDQLQSVMQANNQSYDALLSLMKDGNLGGLHAAK